MSTTIPRRLQEMGGSRKAVMKHGMPQWKATHDQRLRRSSRVRTQLYLTKEDANYAIHIAKIMIEPSKETL
ncbi:hypothetical protein Y1Q_0008687 [Alligator mississippiensis]|uniref:Uncharacterized protein n=1 Tax=Alligator mississippiensis TaxID=8496 RepID=A0A151NA71_ALLMI|nr:hypothetical protein Y1Q_0008687 [Alligator mississippiensis]